METKVSVQTDHVIYSSKRCQVLISFLFSCMLTHGYTPDDMLLSSFIPIPKDPLKLSESDNYRAVVLMSCLSKLLDYIILEQYGDLLNSSTRQFAFKSGRSTAMCTVIFKEVVAHYIHRGSPVYACYVDASKAFDKIHLVKLFDILHSKLCDTLYTA